MTMTNGETTMTTMQDVVTFISSATEAECHQVFEVAKLRLKTVRAFDAAANSANIKVGDKVKLKNISPKYLTGQLATVEGRDGSNFVVKLDNEYVVKLDNEYVGRFGGRLVTVKPMCVEAV